MSKSLVSRPGRGKDPIKSSRNTTAVRGTRSFLILPVSSALLLGSARRPSAQGQRTELALHLGEHLHQGIQALLMVPKASDHQDGVPQQPCPSRFVNRREDQREMLRLQRWAHLRNTSLQGVQSIPDRMEFGRPSQKQLVAKGRNLSSQEFAGRTRGSPRRVANLGFSQGWRGVSTGHRYVPGRRNSILRDRAAYTRTILSTKPDEASPIQGDG